MCEPEELDRLRGYLDKQLSHLQGVVARLANRLQRRLMAQQNRAWEFDLEEGQLDPVRLPRIIIDPFQPMSFKREKDTNFRDTVVTLLIDNSGSMRGRPITVAATCGDILARTVLQKIAEQQGWTIVIENRPGAGGNIGVESVARAAPDGYTLAYGTNGTHASNGTVASGTNGTHASNGTGGSETHGGTQACATQNTGDTAGTDCHQHTRGHGHDTSAGTRGSVGHATNHSQNNASSEQGSPGSRASVATRGGDHGSNASHGGGSRGAGHGNGRGHGNGGGGGGGRGSNCS